MSCMIQLLNSLWILEDKIVIDLNLNLKSLDFISLTIIISYLLGIIYWKLLIISC